MYHYGMKVFTDAALAVAEVQKIYAEQTGHLRTKLQEYVAAGSLPKKAQGFYPEIRMTVTAPPVIDPRASYGFVSEAGEYATTLTRPDLFAGYLTKQIELLLKNMQVPVSVGLSTVSIPVLYALSDAELRSLGISTATRDELPHYFDIPRDGLDDDIIDKCWSPVSGQPGPLALFSAPRTDYSLVRLKHYTGTAADDFQDFVIFTNYPFYMDQFEQLARQLLQNQPSKLQLEYDALVTPDYHLEKTADGIRRTDHPLGRVPQMPTYHLKRAGHKGITIVNIGIGPSNAKTMTDHIAVLRPDAWMMLGHCGGLANTQKIGDYVLAHTYVRNDHVLNEKLPLHVPIPTLAEMEIALKAAIAEITGLQKYELKQIVRTGAVFTTADRNWETDGQPTIRGRHHQTRAIAVDMESATIAANGFRYRVPYATFLCVSDMPLHGLPKMPGMADLFYETQREQHLLIGMRAMEKLITEDQHSLHSRKLRGPYEPAFR
jgi:AMP nucleosidase